MAFTIKVGTTSYMVPEAGDPCDLWSGYYTQLRRNFGKSHAKTLWLLTWKKNGAISCTTSARFNKWLSQQDIQVSNAATRTIADVSEIQSNFLGMGKNLSNVLSYAVPVTLMCGLGVFMILVWNSSKNAKVSDLAMLTPQGRIAKLGMNLKGIRK